MGPIQDIQSVPALRSGFVRRSSTFGDQQLELLLQDRQIVLDCIRLAACRRGNDNREFSAQQAAVLASVEPER
jgi:hypothetical protein